MVRLNLPPLENKYYTKILVKIGQEHPTITELSDWVKKEISTTSEQLNALEEIGCINRAINRNPYYNTKEVSINWQGLTKQYLIYLIKEQKISLSKNEVEDYSKNIYLQKLVTLAIIGHQKSVNNFRKIGTIYQLFEKITMQMIYGDETFSNKSFKKLKRKYQFISFKRFIKDIKNQKMADKRKTFKKLLRQIIKEVENDRIFKKNN